MAADVFIEDSLIVISIRLRSLYYFTVGFASSTLLSLSIMGNSASNAIANRTTGSIKFDQGSISQLVLAVCDFYQQPRLQCRQSNISLVIPQLKEKILSELNLYLLKSVENLYTDMEKDLFVSIYANVIHEAGYLWASGHALNSSLFIHFGFNLNEHNFSAVSSAI
ncbi:hypothetical protein [Paenibacillus polymyxa]|uniref:hypothetical protein n=1 Tax=Paenibacillus polymyxa TaxID=1406 RepID=UPI001CE2859A|nr:hypothetical protein [Paenibacillus polymyxa]